MVDDGGIVGGSSVASPGNRAEWGRLQLAWWLFYPGTALLAARLVYEQTYLTWKHGPLMVGFALAHGSTLLSTGLLLSTVLLHVWVVVCGVALLRQRIRASRGHTLRVAVAVATIAVIYVPYSTWKAAVMAIGGSGGHESAFLVDAAARGDLDLVRKLLVKGAQVDAQDSDGDTALKAAAVAGKREVLRFLIEKGADPNKRAGILESTPLICAAEMGHADIVQLLLAQGADPAVRDKKGRTALTIAERNGHKGAAELLTKAERR